MRQTCKTCGRRGQRDCPARHISICGACCGNGRGRLIDCPADCRHFPFGVAAIETFRKLDVDMIPKLAEVVCRYVERQELHEAVDAMLAAEASGAATSHEDPEREQMAWGTALETAALLRMFHVPSDDGLTVWEALARDGFRDVGNDERQWLEHVRDSRPTVVEIQRIVDAQYLEVVDLLAPDAHLIRVLDPLLIARGVPRFSKMLTWLAYFPHFARFMATGLAVTEFLADPYLARLRELAAAAGHNDSRDFLLTHYFEARGLLGAMGRDAVAAMLRRSDLHQCKVGYAITGDWHAVQQILDSKPDFERRDSESDNPEDSVYTWLRRGESLKLEKLLPGAMQSDEEAGRVGVVGTLWMTPRSLTVETHSKQKMKFVKRMVSKYFGDLLDLRQNLVRDLGTELADGDRDDEVAPGPAAGNDPDPGIDPQTERRLLEQVYRENYERFPDESVPMLDNLTPREAAKRPDMRQKLIALMKIHIGGLDRERQARGLRVSLDTLLDELGLPELK